MKVNNSSKLIGLFLSSFRPPVKMNVAQWSERYRVIEKGNAEAGRVNLNRIPYQREPMESFTDPDVKETVLCWASQTGKTFLLQNLIGYLADLDPCQILVKYPTQGSAESFSRNKLTPMFEETPRLSGLLGNNKQKDSDNTISYKRFKGGAISFIGSNSPSGLRQRSCRVVIQDEISADPASAGDEGNPQILADRRAESFSNAIFVKASTPTVKGSCAITEKMEQSDFRKWYVPCPHCAEKQSLEWANVKWDEGRPESARMECIKCKKHYSDAERIKAIAKGRWIATKPENAGNKIRGYHLNCLYRLIGNKPQYDNALHQLVCEFLVAKRSGTESLKSFANTQWAEAWEDTHQTLETDKIAVRGENYTPQSLPIEVQKITGGADVQKERIELFVAGWGESEECWAIEYKVFHGDTNKPGVWDEFREYLLNASYKKTDGNNLVFSTVLIDSGNGTQQNAILDFSAPLRRYGIYGCKGIERAGIHPPELVKLSTNNARKIHQYMVGTRIAKTIIYDRLTLKEKGAGFIHFPKDQGFDDRYYKQLTSERKIQKYAHGRAYHTFIAYKGQRNEALDVFVYALTANRIKNRTVPYVNPNESKATGPITETPAVIVQPVRKKYIPIDQRIAA